MPFSSLWGGAPFFSLHSSSRPPWLLSFSGQFHVSNCKSCCLKHGHTVFLWYSGFVSCDYSISKIARSRDRSTFSFVRTSSVLSITAVLTCIVGNSDQQFPFLMNVCHFLSVICVLSRLIIVVSICISLVPNNIEHFCTLVGHCNFLKNVCSDHLLVLKVDYLSLGVCFVLVPCASWILIFHQINSWQRLSVVFVACFFARLFVSLAVQGVSVLGNPLCEFSFPLVVSGLIVRSMTHFELIFVLG